MRAHFLSEPGHQVQFCRGLSEEKKRYLQEKAAEQDTVAAQRRASRLVAIDPHAFVSLAASSRPGLSRTSSTTAHATSSGVGACSFDVPTTFVVPMRARQSTLDGHFDAKKKEDVDMAVARFFFHDHIAFHAARSEYPRRLGIMVRLMFPHRMRHCTPPSLTRRDVELSRQLKTRGICGRKMGSL